jgi:hypothetical protein
MIHQGGGASYRKLDAKIAAAGGPPHLRIIRVVIEMKNCRI